MSPGKTSALLTTTAVRSGIDGGEHQLRARDDEIAAQHQIGFASRDANGVDVGGRAADLHMAIDRAALLREAGHVDDADALALEMGGEPQQSGDRHDSGAAQPRDQHAVRRGADLGQRRLWQRRLTGGVRGARKRSLFHARAMHGDKARAKAFETGEILVAGGLVDAALASEFGLQRLHRDAVRRRAAVAAAFAYEFVDDDARVRVGILPALAPATLFGGASLIVDQNRDAFRLRQIALHLVEDVAVVDFQTRRPGDRRRDIYPARR